MSDEHLRTTVCRQLRVQRPVQNLGVCQHARGRGTICGQSCAADGGRHPVVCALGGGVVKRHDAVRDALNDWVAD